MPSHRADAALTRTRRQRPERPAEFGPVMPTLVPHGGALPPGVVDTRPAGTRVIDIRDSALELPGAGGPFVPEVEIDLDREWIAERLRRVDAPAEGRSVPVPDGVEIHDGVLDTRPKGLAVGPRPPHPWTAEVPVARPFTGSPQHEGYTGPEGDEDDVEAHFVGFVPQRSAPVGGGLAPSAPAAPPLGAVTDLLGDTPWSSVITGYPQRGRRVAPAPKERIKPGAVSEPISAFSALVDLPPVGAEAPSAGERGPTPVKPSPYMRRSELRKLEAKRTSRKAQTSALSVPQVGIASALGLATIAGPLSGALSLPSTPPAAVSSAVAASATLVAGGPAVAFPQVSLAPVTAVESANLVADESLDPSVPAALQAPPTMLVTRASRGNERSVLPGCTGVVPDGAAAQNGRLPASLLCTLWDKDHKLRADAAIAFARLNVAYHQVFGHDICVSDAYRTLAEQYAVKRQRGGYAAAPGTSEHGWGLAVDLCGGSAVAGTQTYTWLRANGSRYGWENPDWALPGGPGPYEPWHFEYMPGEETGPGGD